MKLTNSSVLALPIPAGRSTYVYDSALSGFGVRINPGGRKAYFIQFKGRRKTLGGADVLSAEVARTKARELLARAALGEDLEEPSTLTLGDAWQAWTEGVLAYRSESYQHAADTIFRLHIPKRLKSTPVDELTRSGLLGVCEKLVKAGKIGTAELTLALLCALCNRLVDREELDRNPLARAKLSVKMRPRDRVLSDDELKAIWNAPLGASDLLALHTLLLTACRRLEVLELDWSELDVGAGVVSLGPERTKTKVPHVVTLPRLLATRFRELNQRNGRVFTQFSTEGQCNHFLSRVRRAVNLPKPWRLHDLRRTAATNLARLGVAPHVIERVLNHNSVAAGSAGVAGVYNRHAYRREMAAALQLYEDWVSGLVSEPGKSTTQRPTRRSRR